MIDFADNNEPKKKETKSSGTPVLDNFGKELNILAEKGKLDPMIGRDAEVNRIAQILTRRKKNNPIIIGPSGGGKTTLVEGLVMKIVNGDCPKALFDKRIISLDINSIVAGTKYRGQFEERMKVIIEELQANPNIILFIDEIHTIVGAGNSSGSLDVSNILKPALSRGEIQCIGATTFDEYRKSFEKDSALERRFQKVVLDSPNKEETIKILKQAKSSYEKHHKVFYSDEVIELCVNLSDRYITDREFPDKAFDVIDELGSRVSLEEKVSKAIEGLRQQAKEIRIEKDRMVKELEYEKAADLRDKEKRLLDKLEKEKKKFETEQGSLKREIPIDMVYEVISSISKVPVTKLNQEETDTLKTLSDSLNSKIIGQSAAISKISNAIRRSRLGIKDPNKPISLMFIGSTGLGKTYLAKNLAIDVFGGEDKLIRIDMSEYQEKIALSRLIGSSPGYVGYEEGGQLTEKVKNNPYSVILFDEIEKAHRDISSVLLQMLDDGHMTDGLGRKINFKNTIVIMTSNIGAKKLQDFGTGIGFKTSANNYAQEEIKKETLKKELQKFFNPEFMNRIDEIIVFNSLGKEDVDKIVRLELDKLSKRLVANNFNISFDDSTIDFISKVGYDETYGARPIKRAIQDNIEDFIANEVLENSLDKTLEYTVYVEEEKIKIKKNAKKSKKSPNK
jgi:ATP-dependent Clp protease ATP-binding subunit ClpC